MEHTKHTPRSTVERYGQRIVKYRENVAGTRHLVLMEYKGRYFAYLLQSGIQVDQNGREVPGDLVTGTKEPGKHWKEYRDSSLNEWHTAA